ncbi:hypothetical protein [Streptomyces sp. NPDC093111]|uniref:hypothetical protein n=1 Tax=Streptomyces sp. NPDC093111 TaxID=3154978 RepID=UPI00343B3B72
MTYLPTLGRDCDGALVLDNSTVIHACLRILADLYREDPEGTGDALVGIADLGDAVEEERCSSGCGCIERARDAVIDRLIESLGGARVRLDPRVNHRALMQIRHLAGEARWIADVSDARAEELASVAAVARQMNEKGRQASTS